MTRLLIYILFLLFTFFLPRSALAQSCSDIPVEPDSPALDLLISEAQAMGGAAALVPASLLKAIYAVEATTAYRPISGSWTCQKTGGDLGLMQVNDIGYPEIASSDEQIHTEGDCSPTHCKLNRCHPVTAIELAARVLLLKAGLWDKTTMTPTGSLTDSVNDIYYSSGYYYSANLFDNPTDNTSQLLGRLDPQYHYPTGHPYEGSLTYAEFICAQSGACQSWRDFPLRQNSPSFQPSNPSSSDLSFTFDSCLFGEPLESAQLPTSFTKHPLRPFPAQSTSQLIPEEKTRSFNDSSLTPYCAMRPLAAQAYIDKRHEDILMTGTLTQDFSRFITPLLSITNPDKPDYQLPFNDKAQRYLADYLEGRAYYEPLTESVDPTPLQSLEIHSRSGVFRKLAPQSYQDKLKKAIILRANNQFNSSDPNSNPYGFKPATDTIHNYTVGYWDPNLNQPAPYEQGQPITLKDYFDNQAWAPLLEEHEDFNTHHQAYLDWELKDGGAIISQSGVQKKRLGKWAALWAYVPMFTREDTKGFIQFLDDPGQSTSPNKPLEVSHPHLARTYEVTNTLSYMLTPFNNHSVPSPALKDQWYTPAPWTTESPWWFTPDIKIPPADLNTQYGYVCDYSKEVPLIASSGDLAFDSEASTNVDKAVPNPLYENPITTQCVFGGNITHFPCEAVNPMTCKIIDDSACYVLQPHFYNPNYLKTKTPFLTEILTSLTNSNRAVFDLFRPHGQTEPQDGLNWPGVGNSFEESPEYSYTPNQIFPSKEQIGWAEAGYHKPYYSQSFLYRYLGTIQCAKERTIAKLQPFITGQSYQPYSYECFPELNPLDDPKLQTANQSTSSYSYPSSQTGSGALYTGGLYIEGDCPIPGGRLLVGSFESINKGHGSNSYWASAGGFCDNTYCSAYPNAYCCINNLPIAWSLPVVAAPQCYTNPYPGSVAYDPSSTCPAYGFAADFFVPQNDNPYYGQGNVPVSLPTIDGQVLDWKIATPYGKNKGNGTGGLLRAKANGKTYEISIYHLAEPITYGGPSGTEVGIIYAGLNNPHVHIELKVNGEYVRPDNLCSGGSTSTFNQNSQPAQTTSPNNPSTTFQELFNTTHYQFDE